MNLKKILFKNSALNFIALFYYFYVFILLIYTQHFMSLVPLGVSLKGLFDVFLLSLGKLVLL